jgi:5'(3')-deoxyribonucleotidase
MIIYLDMDGVLADFDKFALDTLNKKFTNIKPYKENERWEDLHWYTIKNTPHLYRNLPKTPFADTIVNLARKFKTNLHWDLYILTAVPKNNDVPDAFQDKIEWIQQYYPDIPVRFGPYSKDKQNHAKPNYILVDDRTSNCQEWKTRGGISIQVTENYHTAIQSLEFYYDYFLKENLLDLEYTTKNSPP